MKKNFCFVAIISALLFVGCEKEKPSTSIEITLKYKGQVLPNWEINAHNDWDDAIVATKTTNQNGVAIFDNLQDKLTLHKNDSTNDGDSYIITLTGKIPNDTMGYTFNTWYRITEGENVKEELEI
jgi:hypothetical protein